jgi:hypothetical protein
MSIFVIFPNKILLRLSNAKGDIVRHVAGMGEMSTFWYKDRAYRMT